MKSHDPSQLSDRKLQTLRRIKRFAISRDDLEKARDFALEVMDRDVRYGGKDETLRVALDTAVRVAYARPFTKNNPGLREDVGRCLSSSVLNVLSDREREFHDAVVASRNTTYAHSDAEIRDLNLTINKREGAVSSMSHDQRHPFRPMPDDQLRTLIHICDKLRAHLQQLEFKLANELDEGDYNAR